MTSRFFRLTGPALAASVLALSATQGWAQSSATTGSSTTGTYNSPNDPTMTGQQSQGATGTPSGMSSSMSGMDTTTSGAAGTTGSSNSNLQPLPTEPTAAGYSSSEGYSWLPYTTRGYVGIGFGSGNIDTDCIAGQNCDNANGAVSVYTGGMFNENFGIQLGYFRLGDADRNGGTTKVSGASLVLLGVAPLGTNFSLVGRVGGTYGWTETSVGVGVPAASGDEHGFGATYGVGVAYDFDRNWSVTLDWDRHHLKYAGDQKSNTDVATIGFKYRF